MAVSLADFVRSLGASVRRWRSPCAHDGEGLKTALPIALRVRETLLERPSGAAASFPALESTEEALLVRALEKIRRQVEELERDPLAGQHEQVTLLLENTLQAARSGEQERAQEQSRALVKMLAQRVIRDQAQGRRGNAGYALQLLSDLQRLAAPRAEDYARAQDLAQRTRNRVAAQISGLKHAIRVLYEVGGPYGLTPDTSSAAKTCVLCEALAGSVDQKLASWARRTRLVSDGFSGLPNEPEQQLTQLRGALCQIADTLVETLRESSHHEEITENREKLSHALDALAEHVPQVAGRIAGALPAERREPQNTMPLKNFLNGTRTRLLARELVVLHNLLAQHSQGSAVEGQQLSAIGVSVLKDRRVPIALNSKQLKELTEDVARLSQALLGRTMNPHEARKAAKDIREHVEIAEGLGDAAVPKEMSDLLAALDRRTERRAARARGSGLSI